jgi:hypothetical protein
LATLSERPNGLYPRGIAKGIQQANTPTIYLETKKQHRIIEAYAYSKPIKKVLAAKHFQT